MKSYFLKKFGSLLARFHGYRSSFAIAFCILVALAPLPVIGQAVPLLSQPLSPTSAAPGGNAFTLTVTGTGFASDAVVNWNGSPRVTTFVSGEKLTAAILKSDIATAGTATLTVSNPTGGTSNPVFFPIGTPSSVISMSRNDISASPSANAIAAADFDGNGTVDLAVANGGGNTVSIYLGNGDGTFQTLVNYSTSAGYPDAILAADFNGDGKTDLAVLLQRSNQVSILLGNGNGTFQSPKLFSTGQKPVGLATADLNQDGKLDLAVANSTDNTVSVLLGNGDGSFQTHQDYATGTNPDGVAVGDLNNDGNIDLVVPNNSDDTVSILLNNGSGSFPTHTDFATAARPTDVVIADFNKDGNLDLAVATAAYKVSILRGNGDGTFAVAKNYGVGANTHAIVAGEMNDDGKIDLAVVNSTDNTVSILPGNGDGTFKTQQAYPTNAGPARLALGDFTGSGTLDVATVDSSAGELSVLTSSQLSLTPTFIAFGNQEAGIASNPQTITLKNGTGAAIDLTSFNFVGTNAGDFSQTNTCNGSVASGGSCTISLTFTPTAGYYRSAQLVIDESNGSSTGLAMTGNGLVTITLGPTRTYEFPNIQLVNTESKAKVFTFTNASGITVTISSILVNGKNAGDFPETNNCGSSVAPNQSCTISQYYQPTIASGETAALNVFGNFTAGRGQQAVLLSGKSTAVSINPTSLTFAAQNVGTTSSAQTVTFSNAASTPLSVSSIVIQGTNAKDFAQTNNCEPSVAAQSSCTISVTFKPSATGTRTAEIEIGDRDLTSPQSVSLTGTGQ